MTHKDFSLLLERRIKKTREVLDKKSREYSKEGDKLHNFKRAGRVNDEHPSQSAHGMLTKHLVSYMDMVKDLSDGKEYTREQLDEKFGDIINYFILQEAIFVESCNL